MEHVLAVKREYLAPFLQRSGLITGCEEQVLRVILEHHEFLPRPAAEEDPGYKQVIPYVVICRGEQVFATRRLKKGGEARLHGLLSLGVGGHIDQSADGDGGDVLMRGLRRELHEEVELEQEGELIPRGFINDDGNGVGSVHFGLLFTMETDGEVSVRETEKLDGQWLERADLPRLFPELESWSQIAMEAL